MLGLEFNKIKFIDSAAFRGLNKLLNVDLNGNVCIEGHYQDATSIKLMIATLTDKCGISESLPDENTESVTINVKEQEEEVELMKSLASEASVEELQSKCQRYQHEIAKMKVQVHEMNLKLIDSEQKRAIRYLMEKSRTQNVVVCLRKNFNQETELIALRNATRKVDGELKVNLETIKTQLHLFTNISALYFDNCEQENKKCAIEIRVCETNLLAATNGLTNCTQNVENKNEEINSLNFKITKEWEASQLLINEVKVFKDILNQQLNETRDEMKSERKAHQAVNKENEKKVTQQATVLATLKAQNEMLRNDLQLKNIELDKCKSDKSNLRDDLKTTNFKMEIFTNEIAKFREEIRSVFGLLQNKKGFVI